MRDGLQAAAAAAADTSQAGSGDGAGERRHGGGSDGKEGADGESRSDGGASDQQVQLAVDTCAAWGMFVHMLGPSLLATPGVGQQIMNVSVWRALY